MARSANGTGKTHGGARLAIWWYKAHGDSQVYTAAAPPKENLENLLWGEIGAVVHKHPELFAADRVTHLNIRRSPQEFITGLAIPQAGDPANRQARFSGKHAPHLMFMLDEGDAIPWEIYLAIESCLSGGHGRLVVFFNPRQMSGPLWTKEKRREARVIELSALDHPNVVTGRDVFPGAVSREKTVKRINEWTEPLGPEEQPDAESFLVPDFLAGAQCFSDAGELYPPLRAGWRRVVNPAFWVMVLGQYPPQAETQLIARQWIDAAVARWQAYVARYGRRPPQHVRPVLGLDVAEFGVDRNVLCARYGGWVASLIEWGGVDVIETAIKAATHFQKLDALYINVDGTGIGAGVAPYLQRESGLEAYSIKVGSAPTRKVDEGEFFQLRDQLWWLAREWLRKDPGAMLPPDESLIDELLCPKYHADGQKIRIDDKATMKARLRRSPDHAESLILTFADHHSLQIDRDSDFGRTIFGRGY